MSEQMTRGRTDAETVALNGWGVGTIVRGHEQWVDGRGVWTTWRITAVGEESVLARTIRKDYTGDDRESDLSVDHEHLVTFDCREWSEVATTPPAPTTDPRADVVRGEVASEEES